MDKKKVHIVVRQGLIQAIYADKCLDVDVVIYDMDTEDEAEWLEAEAAAAQLPEFTKQIY
jgi:hypothetical protein